MKNKTFVFLALAILVSGCASSGINKTANLQDQINLKSELESNLSSSFGKIPLKLQALNSNDLSTIPFADIASGDIEVLDSEILAAQNDVKAIEAIINDWESKQPTDKTRAFIDIYKESLEGYKKYLDEASEVSVVLKNYVAYRRQDVEYTRLNNEISNYIAIENDLTAKRKYSEAIPIQDKIIDAVTKKIEILTDQISNENVDINGTQLYLENEKTYMAYQLAFKKGLEAKANNPSTPDSIAFKEADEAWTAHLNSSIPPDVGDYYSIWYDDNILSKTKAMDEMKIDADAKYSNAYTYIKNNQNGQIILGISSATFG